MALDRQCFERDATRILGGAMHWRVKALAGGTRSLVRRLTSIPEALLRRVPRQSRWSEHVALARGAYVRPLAFDLEVGWALLPVPERRSCVESG